MRLLPLTLLAVVVGVALVYTPLLSTGTLPKFAMAQAPSADETTMGALGLENNTMKTQSADRFMLQGQVASPYGALVGPSIVVMLGLLAAAASYIIMRKGLMGPRMVSSPPV